MSSLPDHPLGLSPLSDWAPELARTFVALASDIALVIDEAGVICTVEQGSAGPIAPAASAWVGRQWIDTVSGDTRSKIEKLLKEATHQGVARRREVSHPLATGDSVPVAYTAIRLGENGPVLAVGRDMRIIAAIQQRYIESQQDMERGYWRARQSESRERLLSQVATDAVLTVDAESLSILDASPSADVLFASVGESLIGKPVSAGFAHGSRGAVNTLLSNTRNSGQQGEIRARLLGSITLTRVGATLFRGDTTTRVQLRVRVIGAAVDTAHADATPALPEQASPDAIVVTDSSGRIISRTGRSGHSPDCTKARKSRVARSPTG